MRSLWVLLFVVGALALGMGALTGCAVTGSLYESDTRSILPLSFVGSPTFCWEGLDMTVVDIKPLGWGPDECNRMVAPQPD